MSKPIPHNEKIWEVCTNRHPTTWGAPWGWIEGADGNVCWNNDPGSPFASKDARSVVEDHNTWLEQQTPIAIRILKAGQAAAAAQIEVEQATAELDKRIAALNSAINALHTLKTQTP